MTALMSEVIKPLTTQFGQANEFAQTIALKESALHLADMLADTAKGSTNSKLKHDIFDSLGNAYASLGMWNESLMLHKLHLDTALVGKDTSGQCHALYWIARSHTVLQQHEEALPVYKHLLANLKEIGQSVSGEACTTMSGNECHPIYMHTCTGTRRVAVNALTLKHRDTI